MSKNLMKKLSLVLTFAMAVTALTACGGSGNESSGSAEAEGQYASYWTDDEKASLDSLKQIDEDGYLYEMEYSLDYNLDDIISDGVTNPKEMKTNFKNLYFSESTYDTPGQIYGGCSAFATTNADGHYIMGRNYDWNKDEEVSLVVHSAPKDGYKSVGLADTGFDEVAKGFDTLEEKEHLLYAPMSIVDGLNEKGLACTVLVLEEDSTKQESEKTDMESGIMVRLILDKAASVKEAEELIGKYDVISAFYKSREEDEHGGMDFHWLVTDSTGDAAVFEFVDGELVANRTPVEVKTDMATIDNKSIAEINEAVEVAYPKEDQDYLLVTNFYVSEGAQNTNGEGYWRYQTLTNSLKENPNPTNEEAMSYLKEIKYGMNDRDFISSLKAQGGDETDPSQWAWITVWSEVYDTNDLTLNLCNREDYTKTYTFGIEK